MSDIQYQQTLEQQAQIEELLTKDSVKNWIIETGIQNLWIKLRDGNFDDVLHLYLSEHGLPLDSKIKGL